MSSGVDLTCWGGLLDALDARLKTHPPSALGERYRGGFPPKQWTGWNAIAEDLALDLEDAPFRVCTAAKVAVEADNQNLTSGKVDWGAVENTIQTICYGLSPEVDCLSVNPVIVDKKIADNGQGEQPAYLISFPLVDQKHGDWFSVAELAAAFPSRYNEMMDQWNRVQDGQPPQSSAIHENELGFGQRFGIHPSSASPLVLQSAPSAGREPRDNVPNVRTSRQDGQDALHDIGLRPVPEAANGVIHMFTNHTSLQAPRSAPRDLASIPVPLSPPVPQTVPAAVPIHPIKSPGHEVSRGKSVDVGGPRIVEEPRFIRGQPTDDQARNIVMPPPVDSEEWKALASQAHPLIASNVVYLQELQLQERADMTMQDQNKVQKQEAKPDTRYSLTLLATCCEDSIERKKGDSGNNNMAPENGTTEIQNYLKGTLSNRNMAEDPKPSDHPVPRKLDVQQASLVQSSPLRFRTTPEKKGQAVDQPQASLTPPNEVRPKKFGCAPCLGSTPRYKNQNQRDLIRATGPRKRGRTPKVKQVYPLRPRKKEEEQEVIKGDEPAELPATELSEYVDATTGSLEIDQVDYRLTAEGWEGAVITGAKAVGDSVDVWIKWPEEDASKRYPSSKLVGSDKVHCMMSLIKFYESKTKKRRSV